MSRPKVKLREMTQEEESSVRKLANSQNEPAKMVRRAGILVEMLNDPTLTATDAGCRMGYSTSAGAVWVRRFNENGVEGLKDKPRSGAPRTHDEKTRSNLVNKALQKPTALGLPFEMWTLERLQAKFQEDHGIYLARPTILRWMAAEGFEWKRQQTWFHEVEKHDPQFVEKRGLSSDVTPTHSREHE